MSARLLLYTRVGCHLCTEMLRDARPIARRHGLEIELVDIDEDAELSVRYNTLIPVLALDGAEICHHFLDEAALERALEQAAS